MEWPEQEAASGGEGLGFGDFALSRLDANQLAERGFDNPTALQRFALPRLLDGGSALVVSPSGSGRIALAGMVVAERIDRAQVGLQALVLAPGPDAVLAVAGDIARVAGWPASAILAVQPGLRSDRIGAVIRKGAAVAVGTPSRVADLVDRRALSLDLLRLVIVLEADLLLNLGARPALEKLAAILPETVQTVVSTGCSSAELEECVTAFGLQASDALVLPAYSSWRDMRERALEVAEDAKLDFLAAMCGRVRAEGRSLTVLARSSVWRDQVREGLAARGTSDCAVQEEVEVARSMAAGEQTSWVSYHVPLEPPAWANRAPERLTVLVTPAEYWDLMRMTEQCAQPGEEAGVARITAQAQATAPQAEQPAVVESSPALPIEPVPGQMPTPAAEEVPSTEEVAVPEVITTVEPEASPESVAAGEAAAPAEAAEAAEAAEPGEAGAEAREAVTAPGAQEAPPTGQGAALGQPQEWVPVEVESPDEVEPLAEAEPISSAEEVEGEAAEAREAAVQPTEPLEEVSAETEPKKPRRRREAVARQDGLTEAERVARRHIKRDVARKIERIDPEEAAKEAERLVRESVFESVYEQAYADQSAGEPSEPGLSDEEREEAARRRRLEVAARLDEARRQLAVSGLRGEMQPEGVPAEVPAVPERDPLTPAEERLVAFAQQTLEAVAQWLRGGGSTSTVHRALAERLLQDADAPALAAILLEHLFPFAAGEEEAGNTARLFISLGRQAGVNQAQLIRLVEQMTGVRASDIVRADVLARYSFLEVNADLAERIMREMNGKRYRGREIVVDYAKPPKNG